MNFHRTLTPSMLAFAVVMLAVSPVHADEQTVKLIQLLIQKGILSPGQAKDLLRETGASSAGRAAHGHAALSGAGEGPEAAAPPASPGRIRVTYVPQFIRKQIADEVRAQVMNEAQSEGWAAPDALPEWTKRVRIYGDLRMRAEGDIFDSANATGVSNAFQFVNFSAINNGAPFDTGGYLSGTQAPPPFLNTTENRNRFRIRARLGADATIDDWVSANIRISTGADNGPVSPNQTLGVPGDFSKYAIWLDRAYFTLRPLAQVKIYAGRSPNPYLPSDLMFYPELGFDGVSAHVDQSVGGGVTLFGTAGAFPIFNTALDFSTNSQTKFASRDAYLAGLQAGASWQISPQYKATLGVGIFDFLGAQGSVSSPCVQETGVANGFFCNSDNTRAPFLQSGNTLFAVRNIPVIPVAAGALQPNPQYFGLASRFNVLDIHPRFDILTYHPIDVEIEGEFIKNLAFNRAAILAHGPPELVGPVNNYGGSSTAGVLGPYQGGDTGYMVKLALGQLEVRKRWDWNAFVSYRYLETDATVDAIADSDFHLGGTNAQGYIVGGSLGIARDTYLSLRMFSAEAIAGPHNGNDVIQLDLQSSF